MTEKVYSATDEILMSKSGRHSSPREKPAIHFIGIGGIGMSALARWFLAQNWAVSGSDMEEGLITRELTKQGIKVKIGHKSANLFSRGTSPHLVVYSQAIQSKNPEMKEARGRKVPVLSYPEMIGSLTRMYKTISVSGSHGKSTTTALISTILARAGFDPTVIIGTKLREFGNLNFRKGKSEYLVLEADEYKGAFLRYSPTLAVVTNIDAEHLDFYKNLRNLKKTFLRFLAAVQEGGSYVLNRDDRNVFSLKRQIQRMAKKKNAKVIWYSLVQREAKKIRRSIRIPGEHNVSNALAAYWAGRMLGIPALKILHAIGKYRGAWRRMEYRGKLEIGNWKLEIFDDYAHHPTEIRATLQAFRQKYPGKKIVCVFQPHQAERLARNFRQFQDAFQDADAAVLLPLYRVTGRDHVNPRYTSKTLVTAIRRKFSNKEVYYSSNPKKLRSTLTKLIHNSQHLHAFVDWHRGIIVMMGAGDIVNYTDSLLS